MAGAGKKRAQKERQTHRSSPESSKDSNAPPAGPPGGFDGPGDSSEDPSRSEIRAPAYGQQSSHSRQSSNVPSGAADAPPESSHGALSGSSRAYAPINVADVNRRLDLPGNAYNLTSEVSSLSFVVQGFWVPRWRRTALPYRFFIRFSPNYHSVLLSFLYEHSHEHSQRPTAIVSFLLFNTSHVFTPTFGRHFVV
jgi:hypothetical protein